MFGSYAHWEQIHLLSRWIHRKYAILFLLFTSGCRAVDLISHLPLLLHDLDTPGFPLSFPTSLCPHPFCSGFGGFWWLDVYARGFLRWPLRCGDLFFGLRGHQPHGSALVWAHWFLHQNRKRRLFPCHALPTLNFGGNNMRWAFLAPNLIFPGEELTKDRLTVS